MPNSSCLENKRNAQRGRPVEFHFQEMSMNYECYENAGHDVRVDIRFRSTAARIANPKVKII
jgi:hypothetical protein